jgi:hypothetical protein
LIFGKILKTNPAYESL